MGSTGRFEEIFGPLPPRRRQQPPATLAGLLSSLERAMESAGRSNEMNRFLKDEFNAKAVARARELGMSPLDFGIILLENRMMRSPRVPSSHLAHQITAAALVEAGLTLGCRLELTFVPIERTPLPRSVEDETDRLFASIFGKPCTDPECPCNKPDAVDEPAQEGVVDESHEMSVEDIKAGLLDGTIEPNEPELDDDERQAMQDSLTEEMVNLAGADAHLEADYEDRTAGAEG